MSYDKEFKKAQKKAHYEFSRKVNVPSVFGSQKVLLSDFTAYVNDTVGDPVDFIVCFEKMQEDWEFTESLMKYATEEIVTLLSSEDELHGEDTEWKDNLIEYFKTQIERLEKISEHQ